MNALPIPARSPRVLLAEDDDAMRALVAEALTDLGYEVIEATDGEDALPWPPEDPSSDWFEFDVDLIISDYRMPRLDGLDLLALARRGHHTVPVIIISAFADIDLQQQAASLGAAAVLAKPFALADLVEAVRDALETAALLKA